MRPEEYIDSVVAVAREYRASYLRATLFSFSPAQCAATIGALRERLSKIGSPTATEGDEARDVLEKVVSNLPEEFKDRAHAARKPLVDELGNIILLSDFPQKFAAVEKLIVLCDRDPRRAFTQVIHSLRPDDMIEGTVYHVCLPYFQDLVGQDVDLVLGYLRDVQANYPKGGSIEKTIGRLEVDLRISGLENVWGQGLRRQYARELVQSGMIEDGTAILLIGPTGTSKTFLAEKITVNSPYARLVTVKCPRADDAKRSLDDGILLAKDVGTSILFDEVYAMPLELQEYSLTELGRSDLSLRILSTSSHSVDYLARELKPDFWARINGWQFKLAPLAQKRVDLEEVLRGVATMEGIDLAEDVVAQLRDGCEWPENHRGVKRALHNLAAVCRASQVDRVDSEFLRRNRDILPDDLQSLFAPLL